MTIDGIRFVVDSGFVKVFSATFLHEHVRRVVDSCLQSNHRASISSNSTNIYSVSYAAGWPSRTDISRHLLQIVHAKSLPEPTSDDVTGNYTLGLDDPHSTIEITGY